jgi:hypothetical protein
VLIEEFQSPCQSKFPGKGYGHLDKVVAAYSRWRASHPEIGKLDDEINALQPQTNRTHSLSKLRGNSVFRDPRNSTSETALAARTSPISASVTWLSGIDVFPGSNFLEPMSAVVLPYSLSLMNGVSFYDSRRVNESAMERALGTI